MGIVDFKMTRYFTHFLGKVYNDPPLVINFIYFAENVNAMSIVHSLPVTYIYKIKRITFTHLGLISGRHIIISCSLFTKTIFYQIASDF